MNSDSRYSDLQLFRRILRWARPYRPHLLAMLLLSFLSTPLALLGPVPLQIVIDNVLGNLPLPGWLAALLPESLSRPGGALLVVAIGLLVTTALVRQLQEGTSSWLHIYTGQRMVLSFRARLFAHVQRLSLTFHDTRGTAESIYRIQWDAPAIQHIAVNGIIPLFTSALTVVAMIAVTAKIDATLAVIALIVAPALFLINRTYRKPLRARYSRVKELESSALSVIQEVVSSLRVVKAFSAESREQDRFVKRSSETARAHTRLALFQGGFDLLLGLTTAAGTALVLWFGVRHVQSGVLTLGQLMVVMAYLAQLYGPLRTISAKVADLQSSLASAERAFRLIDERRDVPERPDGKVIGRAHGAIEFRDVSFSYDSGNPVVREVTFRVEPGSRVGIYGPTGAGKSTLANLLNRFYDPDAGVILLDGTDLRDLRIADLRNQFAIVLQDPVLFSTTIAENIAYARPDATRAEIEAAAMAANAHGFIAALPAGYDTRVGERGMRLSGGERQRISLARAFLKDAPILILDEPTSAVDVGTEAAIMEAMERLARGRTSFMIAHRLSTLSSCDVWLEVRDGRVRVNSESPASSPSRAMTFTP